MSGDDKKQDKKQAFCDKQLGIKGLSGGAQDRNATSA